MSIERIVKFGFLTFCIGLLLISCIGKSPSIPITNNVQYVQAQDFPASGGEEQLCLNGFPPDPTTGLCPDENLPPPPAASSNEFSQDVSPDVQLPGGELSATDETQGGFDQQSPPPAASGTGQELLCSDGFPPFSDGTCPGGGTPQPNTGGAPAVSSPPSDSTVTGEEIQGGFDQQSPPPPASTVTGEETQGGFDQQSPPPAASGTGQELLCSDGFPPVSDGTCPGGGTPQPNTGGAPAVSSPPPAATVTGEETAGQEAATPGSTGGAIGGGGGSSSSNLPVGSQSSSCNPASTTLSIKAKGPEVINLQNILLGLGYNLGPKGADGDFGPRTQGAVTQFQSAKGLTPNGIVDSSTWSALCSSTPPPPTSDGGTPNQQSPTPAPATGGGTTPAPVGGGSGTQTDTPSQNVKWKTYKKGLEGNGGPQVKSELTKLRSENKIQISDAEIGILQSVAQVETGGVIQGINTWDSGVVSFGFMQWTLMWGELQDFIKRASEPFKTYGIEIEGTYNFPYKARTADGKYVVKTNVVPGIKGVTNPDLLRPKDWAEKFFKAGLDETIMTEEIKKALEELNNFKRVRGLLKADWNNHFNDPTAVALIFEAYNNKPIAAKSALQNTLAQTKGLSMTDKEFNEVLAKNVLQAYIQNNDSAARLVNLILGYTPNV